MIKICAVIPTYRHINAIDNIIAVLKNFGLHIFIIDDGNPEPFRTYLTNLHNDIEGIIVHHLLNNSGKGTAVMEGFKLAHMAGFTHVLQIDADGQHDLRTLSDFLNKAKAHPKALICGTPIYDKSIPIGRKIGRWVTHLWVFIETLSFDIKDSMCGFRIYPLESVQKLISEESLGRYMDFDTDIIVRLYWRNINIISLPIKVTYPIGNTSNFRIIHDNWLITKMHARLFSQMIFKKLKKINHSKHWSLLSERGTSWGLYFCTKIYHLFGKKLCQIILIPIVLYYYLISKEQRHASIVYLTNILEHYPTFSERYYHFWNFAMYILDTFIAFHNGINKDDIKTSHPDILNSIINDTRGALIIVSHLGNSELAHFLLDKDTRKRLVMLMHTKNAVNYNRIVRNFTHIQDITTVQVSELGPETMIDLKERVENGAWITIAGDRPALTGGRTTLVPFLGSPAPFAQGPWILGSLLECPVYLLFCVKKNCHYELTIEYFSDRIILPRQKRQKAVQSYLVDYATRLGHYAHQTPFQWFNFFNFWSHPPC